VDKFINEKTKRVLIVILGILSVVSLIKGIMNAAESSVDFLYNDFQSAVFQHDYYNAQFPFTFWMMFFFALFSAEIAKNIWIFCNLVFTAVIIVLIRKTFLKAMPGTDYCILVLMMIAGGAWRTNISNGQYKLAFFMFYLLAVFFLDYGDGVTGSFFSRHRDCVAGLFLSMTAFQYTLAVPLGVYFIYRKRFMVMVSAFFPLALSFIGSAWWFGGVRNITLKQLGFSRQLTAEGDVDIQSVLGLGNLVIPIFLAGVLFLIILAYVIKWKSNDDTLFFSIALMTAYATAYQRIYSFFILIIPLGLLWMMYNEDPKDRAVLIASCLMLLLTTTVFFSRTASEQLGLMLTRILFYPAYGMLLFIAFRRGLVFNER